MEGSTLLKTNRLKGIGVFPKKTNQQVCEMTVSLIIRETQLKIRMRYHLTLHRMTIIKKKKKNNKCC